jgi:hypothetical protein
MGYRPETVRRLSCHRTPIPLEILVLETANVSDDDDDDDDDDDNNTYLKTANSLQTARRHEGGVKV